MGALIILILCQVVATFPVLVAFVRRPKKMEVVFLTLVSLALLVGFRLFYRTVCRIMHMDMKLPLSVTALFVIASIVTGIYLLSKGGQNRA